MELELIAPFPEYVLGCRPGPSDMILIYVEFVLWECCGCRKVFDYGVVYFSVLLLCLDGMCGKVQGGEINVCIA